VRGIELGPISYRRRPSTSCRPAFAEYLGYTAAIAGLEFFLHDFPQDFPDLEKVRCLFFILHSPASVAAAVRLKFGFISPKAFCSCPA
jgi:hypothetical protein